MPLVALRRMFLTLAATAVAGLAVAAEDKKAADIKNEAREVKIEDIVLMVPSDWKQQPPANRLRLAQFVVPAAEDDELPTEMVVSFFGGAGGGVDANIGRWVGQFADGRKATVTKGTSMQGTYYFVDVRGTYKMPIGPPIQGRTQDLPNAQMRGIILEREGQGNYFLKLAGPEKTVSAQEEALRASIGGDKKSETAYEVK
ncbi:MAG: hypothetical protein M3552_07690 [Planctomycetota bacterium]|nr:hypothetical protein [Planctomycetaceae bacterium]MDQ3330520.1 hypothetical protein [Planctomycetota bacterium]